MFNIILINYISYTLHKRQLYIEHFAGDMEIPIIIENVKNSSLGDGRRLESGLSRLSFLQLPFESDLNRLKHLQ